MTNINEATLSIFVDRAIPEFIRREHPKFHRFIESFFEFAERQYDLSLSADQQYDPSPYWVVQNILANNDIDEAYEEYLKYIHSELAPDWPLQGDNQFYTEYDQNRHRQILKIMVDFYRSKGTVDSFSYFFRAVFNKFFDYYLPKVDILRASDGKWDEPYLMGLEKISGAFSPDELTELGTLVNSRIIGLSSGAEGFIELITNEFTSAPNATSIQNAYTEFYKINDNIYYTVKETATTVTTTYPFFDSSYTGWLSSDLILTVDGMIQEIGVDFNITGSDPNFNIEFTTAPLIGQTIIAQIVAVTNQNWIQISGIKGAFQEGENVSIYPLLDTGDFSSQFFNNYRIKSQGGNPTDNPYQINPLDVGICRPNGDWINTDGFLSSDKRLQDSFYWQDFSYEIRTDLSLSDFNPESKNLLHPAGFIQFNKFTEEEADLLGVPGTPGLAYNWTCVHICDEELTSISSPSEEQIIYDIHIGEFAYIGLDWGTLSRYNSSRYATYLKEIVDQERADNVISPLRPVDFLIRGRSNHTIAYEISGAEPELISQVYVDEHTNYHQVHGQHISFFQPVTDIYRYEMTNYKRDFYTEHSIISENDGSQFSYGYYQNALHGDETSHWIFVGNKKLLADGIEYTAGGGGDLEIPDVAAKGFIGQKITMIVFNIGQNPLRQQITADGGDTYSLNNDLLPADYQTKYLVFIEGTVIPDNKYIIKDNNIIFNENVLSGRIIEINTTG